MNVLETERLILREFTTDDSAFLLELLNTPTWLQFIGDRGVRTPEQARTYIEEKLIHSYKTAGFGFYLTALKNNNIPIGMCGLVKRDTLEDVDIGFAFLPQHVGNGYAYEAAAATLIYAKQQLGLTRIVAITNVDNSSSIKLLNKIGLQFEKKVTLTPDEELLLFAN